MAAAIVVLAVAAVLVVATDLHGRDELRRTAHSLASTQQDLTRTRAQLRGTRKQTTTTATEAQLLGRSVSQTRTSIAGTNASISSTEQGLFLGVFDVSALTQCLSGVSQALDQVSVGQTQGALWSLAATSTSCDSARPGGG